MPEAITFPVIGDIISLSQADYLNGVGALSVRLIHVPEELTRIPTLEWVRLIGVEIICGGKDGRQRILIVRVEALRRQPVVFRSRRCRLGGAAPRGAVE